MKIKIYKILSLLPAMLFTSFAMGFELLSEGAMGSVSAVSANTAEEIVSVAGPTAAGLRVDDGYEVLPFKVNVRVDATEKDEVTSELDFSLVKEVDSWSESLRKRNDVVTSSNLEVGYVDELPPSTFDESSFVVRDENFDITIDQLDSANLKDTENNTFEIGRVEQAITKIEQKADSVRYIVQRNIDFVATIDAAISNDSPSIGSGYITNLTSISNVRIATFRD